MSNPAKPRASEITESSEIVLLGLQHPGGHLKPWAEYSASLWPEARSSLSGLKDTRVRQDFTLQHVLSVCIIKVFLQTVYKYDTVPKVKV